MKLLCEEGFPGNEGRASLFPCIPRSPAEGRHGRPRTPQPGTAAVPSPAWLRGSPALPLPSSRPGCFRSPTRETAFSFFRPPEVILYQVGNKALFFFFFPCNTNKTITRYRFYQNAAAIKLKIWKRKLTTVYDSSGREKKK